MRKSKVGPPVKEVVNKYIPHTKQLQFHQSIANEILFGGSAGPGKSMALRQQALDFCMRVPNLQVYLFRRVYPDLEREQITKSKMEFPKGIGTYKKNDKRWEFMNGSMLNYGYAQYEDDVQHYQGAEINVLMFDELTEWTEFMYKYLRGRVRCSLTIPEEISHKIPGIYSASNPGNIGHEWVKRYFIDNVRPYEIRQMSIEEGGMTRQFIPGLMEDNPSIDKGYRSKVEALPEPLRSAWLNGDWDIHMGQAFSFNETDHVIDPVPIPENAPIYFTYDYGLRAPFSCLWFWEDNDHRLYLFDEWYGWNGEPNKGLRLTDSEVAEGIIKKEKEMGIAEDAIHRVLSPDCFNTRFDHKGGGQGPSTAEVFFGYGLRGYPGDPNRQLKIRQFHERLRVKRDDDGKTEEPPMLVVYKNCSQFIRTIPLLQYSVKQTTHYEYIDTGGNVEDHCFDSACLAMMLRPIENIVNEATITEKEWNDKVAELDPTSRRVAEKFKQEREEAVKKYQLEQGNDVDEVIDLEEDEELNDLFI